MPEEPLDPYVALDAIRTFAKGALANEKPTLRSDEQILREILKVCDWALTGDQLRMIVAAGSL